jgi:nucleotide-binding universal stress UspA family protein
MKILAAVDGSSYTKRMLAYLAAHDEWLGPQHQYTLVHAVPGIPQRVATVLDRATLNGYHEEAAERVFKPIRSFFERQGLRATYLSRVGPPAPVIAAAAAKGDVDLIVMGTHGHGAVTQLVLGSVATKVIAQTDVPVLLVR